MSEGQDAARGFGARMQHENEAEFQARQKLAQKLAQIKHKILVMSGKGGVGKSTVAVNLASALAAKDKKVGLLDVDIHGPSLPTMLGLENSKVISLQNDIMPVELGNLRVMSLGLLLENPDQAVVWRGPMKISVIKQFLDNVVWGELDYLIIDSPPGTGDEPLSVCQYIGELDGALIVTTPQKVATVDVRKSVSFCKQINLKILGLVENMSGFACPNCGEITQILPPGGGRGIAESMNLPFLGAIPMDPQIALAADMGKPFLQQFAESASAKIMQEIIKPLLELN